LYYAAVTSLDNREALVASASAMIEVGLTLVGSSAIEDKLQDGVPETIKLLKQTDIVIWVLTGDKLETAINIGFSAGLIDNETTQYIV
jgi:phospholipid-translocating ATPase